MTIALRPFSELDQTVVDQAKALALQSVQEANPGLDLRRGVLADLLVYYHAALGAQLQTNVNDYLSARSLAVLTATTTPELLDPALVDDAASNFRVTRRPGGTATGDVVIVVADDVTVTVAAGAVFAAGGLNFLAAAVYTAKAESSQVVGTGDRLLTPTADGRWAFTITVVAAAAGAAYSVRKDALVTPQVLPPGYVTAYAAADFAGGADPEDNASLVARLSTGVAARALSNRRNMQAALLDVPAFAGVGASSIVGYGDAEMHRDRHSIFPISSGGRADWYVRTQAAAARYGLTASCVLLTKAVDHSVWQFALARDDAPGFYEVSAVRPLGAASGSFAILTDARALDTTGLDFVPDLAATVEGVYSRYQTAVLTFADTTTDVSALNVGDRRDYAVEVTGLPLIADVQDYVAGRDVRGHAADCLVKAPVPCFVQVNFTVQRVPGDAAPDVAAIAAALAAAVATVGFVGALHASPLLDVVHGFLSAGQTVQTLDLLGRIRRPDGNQLFLRDPEKLAVPADPDNLVSARTVQFFLNPADVAIAVAPA